MAMDNAAATRPVCPKCGGHHLRDGSCLMCGCIVMGVDYQPPRRCLVCGVVAVFSGGVCPACARRGMDWRDAVRQDTPPEHARAGSTLDQAAFDAAAAQRREKEKLRKQRYRIAKRERERKLEQAWAELPEAERDRRRKRNAQQRAYRKKTEVRAKIRAANRAYHAKNREHICERKRARYAAKRAAEARDG